MKKVDVLVIGAGAAGLMCAIEAGKRKKKVYVIDHSNKVGKKILISGGGRCNFTNYYVSPEHYISHNPHFCKSALKRYSCWDFVELVKSHHIPFHEKKLGQLFCDNKASDIVSMLMRECTLRSVSIQLNTKIFDMQIEHAKRFIVKTSHEVLDCEALVIATGGLSFPTMGASPFGYQVAKKFGINVWPTRAGLVPLTWHEQDKSKFTSLSGVSVYSSVKTKDMNFLEDLLFTHRGLSGPSILQISSYWKSGEHLYINLLPNVDMFAEFKTAQKNKPHQKLCSFLGNFLPRSVIECFLPEPILNVGLSDLAHNKFLSAMDLLQKWHLLPNGTEGYRTAEVTLGGVDCDAISSKTMESHTVPGLYFIGEVLDITGWLGGYNFQWAWSSGWVCGQVV